MKVEKVFCTTTEAASILAISVGTVQLWVDNGLLEAWKTAGGHRRVTRKSINKILHASPAAQTEAPTSTASERQNAERLRVLVVEDDPDLLRLYRTMLSRWPMVPLVETSDNGIEALLAVERLKPDLLFIDLNIPGVDGFQMLKILNGKAGYEGMTVVVVSGLSPAEIAQQGGVPANILVLPKPISFDKLLAIATTFWAQKQGRQNTPAP
jgi:excisionase family DNA binding protein